MKRKRKAPIRTIAFFGTFILYYAAGCIIYPVKDNVLQAPDTFAIWGVLLSVLAAVFSGRIAKKIERENYKRKHPPLEINYANLDKAALAIFESQQASWSLLEMALSTDFETAQKLMAELEKMGVVSAFDGKNPRRILVTPQQYLNIRRLQVNGHEELTYIDTMQGLEFEHWCAALLSRNGFENVEVTRGSGDQGVDVLAEKDGIKYAIQCKCYSKDLGNTPVQEINAGKTIYHCHIGAVMTNRYFTAGAKEAAAATGVLLWDRDVLQRMYEIANPS